MHYIKTFTGHRYLIHELEIASGQNAVTNAHWDLVARSLNKKYDRYLAAAPIVQQVITPSKVTSHRNFVHSYLGTEDIISWAGILFPRLDSSAVRAYYNPILLSDLDSFFLYDAHWKPEYAYRYLRQVIDFEIGIKNVSEKIRGLEQSLIGNCVTESDREKYREKFIEPRYENYDILFQTSSENALDSRVRKVISHHSGACLNERVLIIHSSNYQFARNFFCTLFREVVEVSSPYISDTCIATGEFDRVIIFSAERNLTVVYDGDELSERVIGSLKRPHIVETCRHLTSIQLQENISETDIRFFRSIAKLWAGE